jgi:hypothetical protein
MVKIHGGSGRPQGSLHRGTAPQPSPLHGGTTLAKGVTHAPRPRVYGVHGGRDQRMGVLSNRQ